MMHRSLLALALVAPLFAPLPACKFASRQRVQSINRLNEGISLQNQGRSTQAEAALQEAIQLDPTHAQAHYALAQVYTKQSKFKDAENAYRAAIDASPEAPNANYWYDLGRVISAQGDAASATVEKEQRFKGAIDAYQEAIRLDPMHHSAQFRMGVLHERLDQPDAADAALRKSIELAPQFRDVDGTARVNPAFVSLGNLYIEYGHANVGHAVLETGIKVNDKDAAMWNGLGRAQLKLNNPTEAVDSFQRAKAIDPDMPDVLFGLGMAYADLRKRNEAVESLQAFLSRAGNDVPDHLKKAAQDTIARMQDVI